MQLARLPRVVQLELATLTLPEWHPEAASDSSCVVYGYAIDHPDGVIVFDTGVGADSEIIDEMYEPNLVLLDKALTGAGMALDSVVAVVNSHLHFDHCGQNPLLYDTDVPFYIGAPEIDSAENDPIYTVTSWALPPDSQRNLLSSDTEIAEGITVLTAPGHTAGHVALLVESTDGRVVLGGQAVWNSAEFLDEVATAANVDDPLRAEALDTIRRLKALNPRRVYFSHCAHLDLPTATETQEHTQ